MREISIFLGMLLRAAPLAVWLAIGLFATTALKADPEIAITDDLDGPLLDRAVWTERQIHRTHYRFDRSPSRPDHGQSLEITIHAADNDCISDTSPCQRSEIRVKQDRQITFGTEAWYGFSFRVDGYVDPNDSNRLVIGQWKEQSGGSPFIAQRFDNRIFRITIQDGECRAIIAEMPRPADRFGELLQLTKHGMKCNRSPEIKLIPQDPASHILPNPYRSWVDMVYRVRGGRNGDGLVEVWANGKCVVRAEGTIGNRDVGGPYQYFKFGVYRDKVAYPTRIHLDNFKRGVSHRDVDPDFSPCPW